jgi:hypothetical protein
MAFLHIKLQERAWNYKQDYSFVYMFDSFFQTIVAEPASCRGGSGDSGGSVFTTQNK